MASLYTWLGNDHFYYVLRKCISFQTAIVGALHFFRLSDHCGSDSGDGICETAEAG